MAKKNNQVGKVPCNEIVSGALLAQRYVQIKGGSIKEPVVYGVDPLEFEENLKNIRDARFRDRFPTDGNIFEEVISGNPRTFSSAICFFQNITIELSNP